MRKKKYKKWTDEKLFAEARKYTTRFEFQKGSWNAYRVCLRRGILDDVCSHMEGNPYVKWTDEKLFAEASKYKTRFEFQKGSKSAYDACQRRRILDDVCSHMEFVRTCWTDEMLFAEARKYKTRGEFKKANESAYHLSHLRGILNEVCSHMETPPYWDKPHCVYLIEIFTKNNELYYYVGQTCNLEDRLYRHFRNNKGTYSPVFEFIKNNPIKYKMHFILKKNLTYEKSLELESEIIKDLKDREFKLLNKELL